MEIKVIVPIIQLVMSGLKSFSLEEGSISNDAEFAFKSFFTQPIADSIGLMESDRILSNTYFYCHIRLGDFTIEDFGPGIIGMLDQFLTCLWLVKDNACHRGNIVVRDMNNEKNILLLQAFHFFNCSGGTFSKIAFTESELSQALEYFKRINTLCEKVDMKPPTQVDMQSIMENEGFRLPSFNHNQQNILERSMAFLTQARSAPNLALKIANYVMVIECIYSSETTEVSHRVAERTAFYL